MSNMLAKLSWVNSGDKKPSGKCLSGTARWRLVSVIAITILATVMVLFKCIGSSLMQTGFICCSQNIGAGYRRVLNDDYDYDGHSPRIRYKHTKRRLPQCLIVGVRKGGTRALLEFLNLHPSIQAQKKEMHFFDSDDEYNLGLEWYRKRMPYSFPDQLTVEKTPAYFVTEKVPERVHQMNATIKLILVLRDPTERAISDYTQIHANKLEKGKPHQSFEDFVLDPETGEVRHSYNALRRSMYHRHMAHWLQWFRLDQFHFVSGENLVKDPITELRMVESFLGIEHKLTADNFYFNETRGFFCLRLESRDKCLAKSKGRTHPDISPLVLKKLHDYFRPHNQKFYDMVGRDFGWP